MYVFHAHAVQNESDRRFDSVRPHSHRAHVRPVRACSCSVRARLAPLLRPPCKVGACAHPFEGRRFSRFRGSGPLRPSFSPARIHLAHRPPPAPGALHFSHSGPLRPSFSSARPRPHRSPEFSPCPAPIPLRPRPGQRRTTLSPHNTMTAQNHDAAPPEASHLSRPSPAGYPSPPLLFSPPGQQERTKKDRPKAAFLFRHEQLQALPCTSPVRRISVFYTRSMSCGNTACGSGCAPGCASGSFRQTACHSEATSTKFCTHCATFEPSSMRMDITP